MGRGTHASGENVAARSFISSPIILQLRPELVAVDDQAILAILPQSPCNHLHWHADANVININIRQLGCHQGAFIQLDESCHVWYQLLVTGRSIINNSVRINFSFSLELVRANPLGLTLRADLPLGKEFRLTILTPSTDQLISLILQTPMFGQTHVPIPSRKLTIIAR